MALKESAAQCALFSEYIRNMCTFVNKNMHHVRKYHLGLLSAQL